MRNQEMKSVAVKNRSKDGVQRRVQTTLHLNLSTTTTHYSAARRRVAYTQPLLAVRLP